MTARELREKFIGFFVSKNHAEIPSSPLIPENDPTTLFISAGMHPLVPYLLGSPHPLGKRLTDVQKCVRTGDIDEVGDTYHHTFFEMLGNWSLGDYFKKEALSFSFEFLTSVLNIDPKNLYVTCFSGNKDAPKDEISAQIWRSLGVPDDRIVFLPDNWWGPAGTTGPCGPDSEMFIDIQPQLPQVSFEDGNQSGRYLEIWNDVFMEYNKNVDGTFSKLSQQNVDTGMGVERTVAVLQGLTDDYLTDIWQPIIKVIERLSHKSYALVDFQRPMRIVADHIRAAVFITADGIEPSNKEAGYVLRRLIRRTIRQAKILGVDGPVAGPLVSAVIENRSNYAGDYEYLADHQDKITQIITAEETKFLKTITRGLNQIKKLIQSGQPVTGQQAFDIYQSFGFPFEMIQEELLREGQSLNEAEFEAARKVHQEQSRTLSAGKFKSGLADQSQITTKYHTATHLLHAALRQVLGDEVRQSGSNITADRLRFDFTYPHSLSSQQITSVEKLVNNIIDKAVPVTCKTMPFKTAQRQGALAFFSGKYPPKVSVYTIADFSQEVCAGPHVDNTNKLGKFTITKEESAGSGKRRIYASLS